MMRLLAAVLCVGVLIAPVTAEAAGYCPSQPGGKCPTKKNVSKKPSDFTAAQRKELMEKARKICVKAHGQGSPFYLIDYARWEVVCEPPGY
jgi:hypothetical protein